MAIRVFLLLLALTLGACATRGSGPVWPYPDPPRPGDPGTDRTGYPGYPGYPGDQGSSGGGRNGREPVSSGASASSAQARQPAVQALVEQAEEQIAAGDYDSAAASLERALRIDGGDPLVWERLASLRFEQGNLIQAENLARRSLSYGGNGATARNAWLLIADIKRLQGDEAAAATARRNADSLR